MATVMLGPFLLPNLRPHEIPARVQARTPNPSRTARETQDTRFFEASNLASMVRSFNGTKWVNRHSSLVTISDAEGYKRAEGRLYAGFGDERAGLYPRPGTERNG
jgi:hypothetical protein